jgi:hypothetical protein
VETSRFRRGRRHDAARERALDDAGGTSRSPRLLVFVALGILLAIGAVAKAGAGTGSIPSTGLLISAPLPTTTSTSGSVTTTSRPPTSPKFLAMAGDGTLDVTTVVESASGTETIDYTLDDGTTPTSFSMQDGDPNHSESIDSTHSYTLNADTPAGWSVVTTGLSCPNLGESFTPPSGAAYDCTYTFTQPVQLTVHQSVAPTGDPTAFDYSIDDGTTHGFFGTLADGASQTADVNPDVTTTLDQATPAHWVATVSGDPACGSTLPIVIDTASPGDSIDCTVTDTRLATVNIHTSTDPPGSSQSFDYTSSVAATPTFSASDGDVQTFDDLTPGDAVTVHQTVPAGWSVAVSGAGCSYDSGTGDLTVTPAAGDVVDCTFADTQLGSITLNVTSAGGDDSFTVDEAMLGSSSIATSGGAGSYQYSAVAPGSYGLQLSVPAHWVASGFGGDCASDGTIALAAGQDATCSVTVTKAATIDVTAATDPAGDPTAFTFNADNGLAPASFDLLDTQSQSFADAVPGQTYTLTEDVPAGWSLITSGSDCTATTNGVTVTPTPGETVDCGFTNSKHGSITVDVTATGGDDTLGLDEATLGAKSVTTSLGQGTTTYDDVLAGTYDLDATAPAGWLLSDFSGDCGGGGQVTLAAGADLHCAITMTKAASITIGTTTDPAGSAQSFDYQSLGAVPLVPSTFSQTDGQTQSYTDLTPSIDHLFQVNVPAGWTAGVSGAGCAFDSTTNQIDVDPAAGVDVSCTVAYTQLGSITLDVATQGGDSTFPITEATLGDHDVTTSAGTGATSYDPVAPGAYDLDASPVPGWEIGTFGGDCNADGTISLAAGRDARCTLTATKDASITIHGVNDPATADTFAVSADNGLTPASFQLSPSSPQSFDSAPGVTYTFTETLQAGWVLTTSGPGCSSTSDGVTVTPGPGDVVDCTFINTKLGSVTIQKTTIGGDGTFDVADATLGGAAITTSGGTGSVTYPGVLPGSYSFGETPTAGWTQGPFGGDCGPSGDVVVAAGEDAVCTITNTKLATIDVKVVTDPAGSPQVFDLGTTGLPTPSFQLADGDTQTFLNVTPNQPYAVHETVPAHWHLDVSGPGCAIDPTGFVATPAPGQVITCTFTNTQLATIGIHKVTDGGDGTFTFTNPTLGSRTVTTVANDGVTSYQDVTPGTYAIQELPTAGWMAPSFGGSCDSAGNVTVQAGQSVTCLVQNVKFAAVHVSLTTAPAGAGPFGFTSSMAPPSFSLSDGGTQSFGAVAPYVDRTVTASVPAGWKATVTPAPGCTNFDPATNTLDVDPVAGQTVACTFQLVKLGSITIQKTTIGGDGTFSIIEPTLGTRSITTSAGSGSVTYSGVLPGTYSFGESAPGWSSSPFGGSCSPSGTVVLNAGQNLTCTLTNTKLAVIRIDKVTAPTADPTPFSFSTTGGLSPSSFLLADQDPPVVFANVVPNQPYNITEATPANWQLGTSGAGCASIAGGVKVTPPPGADITCTFTNTESGTITIDKTALGGDGSFQIKQPTLGNQIVTTVGGVGSITYANVIPGSYTFGETPVAGWTQSPFGGDCGPSGTVVVTPGAQLNCTLTNTKLADISIQLVTDPASSPQKFTLDATGPIVDNFKLGNGGNHNYSGVTPNQAYTFTQTVPAGWSLATSGGGCAPTAGGVVVTPQPGQSVTCTFTDTAFATISMEKDTIGGDGTFDIVEPTLGTKTITTTSGVGTADYLDVLPGTYQFDEPATAGWAELGFSGDCAGDGTVTVQAGDALNCQVFNVKLGRVTLAEVTQPSGSPTQMSFTAPSDVSPTSFQLGDGGTQSFDDLNPGQDYTFTQAVPAGWSLVASGTGCTYDAAAHSVTITPNPGDDLTCTFTDTQLGSVTIQKTTLGGDGTFGFTEPTLGATSVTTSGGTGAATYSFAAPGTYHLHETPLAGWSSGTFGGDCAADGTVTFTAGSSAVCTITNTKLATITVDEASLPSSDPTSFNYTSPGLTPTAFALADATAPRVFANVAPGQPYAITQAVPAGWSLATSGAGCTSAAGGVTVTPQPGDAITCTFTNTKLGSIHVSKTTVGGDGTFPFSAGSLGTMNVTTSSGAGIGVWTGVAPGHYDVDEAVPAGWSAGPFGGDCAADGTIDLAPGQIANCTITDTKLATITIKKKTSPAGDTTPFSFAASGGLSPATFPMKDGSVQLFTNVVPNQPYTVTEATPLNWLLSVAGTGCTPTKGGTTITPAPGQNIDCTFTNTRLTPVLTVTPSTVAPGATVTIDLSGFPPGGVFAVNLIAPDGHLVAQVLLTTDATGHAKRSVVIGTGEVGGVYTVTARGVGITTVTTNFTVQDPSKLLIEAAAPDSTSRGKGGLGSLAFTGDRAFEMALLAIILVLSGIATYWFARRRRII